MRSCAIRDIQAVVIATPGPRHFPLAKMALEAGKDVYVEKPFTLEIGHAEELIALAEKHKRVLMVGHLLEYHPVVTRLKEMIAREELGRLYYIYSQRVNLGTVRADENALWNFAPHDISVIMFLLGAAPTDVAARGQCYLQKDVEDVVFLSMNFGGRAMAHVHVSWLDPHKIRKLTLVGDRKMAVFDDLEANEKLRVYDKGAQVNQDYNTFAEYVGLALRRHHDALHQGRRAAADRVPALHRLRAHPQDAGERRPGRPARRQGPRRRATLAQAERRTGEARLMRYASLSLDLDNQWSYMKTHGDAGWQAHPSYLDVVVPRILAFLAARRAHDHLLHRRPGRGAREESRGCCAAIAAAGPRDRQPQFPARALAAPVHAGRARRGTASRRGSDRGGDGQSGRAASAVRASACPRARSRPCFRRGYDYDATVFPNLLNPLARAYLFSTSKLTAEEKKQRSALFGTWKDAFRPVRPFQWRLAGRLASRDSGDDAARCSRCRCT